MEGSTTNPSNGAHAVRKRRQRNALDVSTLRDAAVLAHSWGGACKKSSTGGAPVLQESVVRMEGEAGVEGIR
jgi:hypothetical protein